MPSDPRLPGVGLDAMPKQLIAATRLPWPVCEGHPVREDYAYERQGVCHLFWLVEPRRGWRTGFVRERRTKGDGAEGVRRVLAQLDPKAIRGRWLQDNLNPPPLGARYQALAPEEARRLARRLESQPTPRHGRWLNRADTELAILDRPGLDRRLEATEWVRQEVDGWETRRHEAKVPINWRLTMAEARVKLKSIYPSIKH